MNDLLTTPSTLAVGEDDPLFESIAQDIHGKGYSIRPNALPAGLASRLLTHLQALPPNTFTSAGVGRDAEHTVNGLVRRDDICWINTECDTGKAWAHWATSLQIFLNRRLLLGLFSFESHFAHYAQGDFYTKHQDAFKGDANRVLSLVVYLNPDWLPEHGGELLLYSGDDPQEAIKVVPEFGTLVVFLSEDFPHEVLPANRDRFSIAGWFRVNSSSAGRVDPPM